MPLFDPNRREEREKRREERQQEREDRPPLVERVVTNVALNLIGRFWWVILPLGVIGGGVWLWLKTRGP